MTPTKMRNSTKIVILLGAFIVILEILTLPSVGILPVYCENISLAISPFLGWNIGKMLHNK